MKYKEIYSDPAVISQVDILLREYQIDNETANKIKDIVYYDSPMRASDSFKQHIEYSMAVIKAFTLGYSYKEKNGTLSKILE